MRTEKFLTDAELRDKLDLVYPPVLVGSEVQVLLGLDLLPWNEADQERFRTGSPIEWLYITMTVSSAFI